MLLFHEDFRRYPSAIIDLDTPNRSFVRQAAVYREMGIKNHAFILALVNPELKGVNPFSPHLTFEQMGAIAIECRINPWYFFREVARVPVQGSKDAVSLDANRGNIALFWCFFNHITIILIQIRQTGKSVSTDVLMTLLMNILCQNTNINLLTKDDILRRSNIVRLKDIALELPRYLRQGTKADANNGEEVTIESLGNKYNTHVPQSSAKRALNMGRGLTSPIFHVDEAPFQANISLALPAALAATGAAIDAAKKAGTPYGNILTTTAGKKDDRDGRFVFELVSDAAVWTEAFFDAQDRVQLEKMVLGATRSREGVPRRAIINATFNHQQLGKTDEWLAEKLAESLQKGEDANRDYFNMWTSGSQSNPLPLHILDAIAKSVRTPSYTDISKPHCYVTRWYIPENEIHHRMTTGRFVMGMDTSEASGGDDISLVIVDTETLEVVATGTYNETNLISFSQWVCSILVTYKNVTAIIERRSTGAMLLDYLLLMLPEHGEDPFKRLYNRIVNDYDEFPDRMNEIRQPMGRRAPDIYVRYKKAFGFATSASGASSRGDLYSSTLQLAAERSADKIVDKTLIDQITGLVIRNGRVDHAVGEHDDVLIGWLLCNWLLTLGKNLSYYGIDVRSVMSAIRPAALMSDAEFAQQEEQNAIRVRITALAQELADENDEYVSRRLEQELRMLDRRLILETGEVYSLDGLIQQAADTKKARKRPWGRDAAANNTWNPTPTGSTTQVTSRPMSMHDFYR